MSAALRMCYYCNDPFHSEHQLKMHVKRVHGITDPAQIDPALQDLYALGLVPRPKGQRPQYRLQQWFATEERVDSHLC